MCSLEKKENGLERNTCQKKLLPVLENSVQANCVRFIGVSERMKTMQITKRHLMQLQLKLDNLN